MFKINDYVMYGNKGICKVEEIGTLNVSSIDKSREYYTLSYVFGNGGNVFTPVDSDKVIMRYLIDRKDIPDLIKEIPDLEELNIPNEKAKEKICRDALQSCDLRQIIRLIKTLEIRRKANLEIGKNINQLEDRFLKQSTSLLFGELSVSLSIDKEKVDDYITVKLQQMTSFKSWR